MNQAWNTPGDLVPSITPAQRKCLCHILRNALEGLEGVLYLVENEDHDITPQELHPCMKGINDMVGRLTNAFESGDFCALREEECSFMCKFVGCSLQDVARRRSKSSSWFLSNKHLRGPP